MGRHLSMVICCLSVGKIEFVFNELQDKCVGYVYQMKVGTFLKLPKSTKKELRTEQQLL